MELSPYMPKGIQQLMLYWNDSAEYNFLPELLESALFFNAAAAIQIKNTRIVRTTNKGTKRIVPSYYAIVMAVQGAGKNYSIDLTAQPFEKIFEAFITKIDNFTANPNNRDEKNELLKQYVKMSSHLIPVSSSAQGLQKGAQTCSDLGVFGVNAFSDEIGNHITGMEEVMTKLKQAYDTGESQGDLISSGGGEQYFTVKDIAFNAMLMGSPSIFNLNDKLKQALLMHLVSGMARRSFVYFNTTYKKSENRNINHETMSEEDIQSAKDYMDEMLSHIRNLKDVQYPANVRKELIQYDIDKEVLRENSDSSISSELGSPKKIERLAGIIAVLDLSDTITSEHMKYAIDYSERVDATAEQAIRIKPIYELIYDILSSRGFISRTELLREVKNLTLKNLDDEIMLTTELASQLGNSVVTKEYSGIVKYKLERLTATKLNKVLMSRNKDSKANSPEGFQSVEGDFNDLHKLICSTDRYSAGTFLNQYITNNNYLSNQNIIILDIDDGITIEEAKSLFNNTVYLIATTKSHQIEKNNLVCDRFRLVLPTISKFHLKPEEYSKMYGKLMEALGMESADSSCRNASRWYYGHKGEHWYNPNEQAELLDIRPFIPDTSQERESASAVNNYEYSHEDDDTIGRKKAGMIRWCLSQATMGSRNDIIFNYAAYCLDIPGDNVEQSVHNLNAAFTEPLSEGEVNKVIRSATGRK